MQPRMSQMRALVMLAMMGSGQTALAAATAISDVPLGQINGVAPNVIFILDDSGSMDELSTENMNGQEGKRGFTNHLCNQLYYNPSITYTPGITYTGANYVTTTFTSAKHDAYGVQDIGGYNATGSSNLSTTFRAYSSDSTQAAYYYNWLGASAPTDSQCKMTTNTSSGTTLWAKVTIPAGQQQNFANWFSYYRSRMQMMKTVAGQAFHNAMDPTNSTTQTKFRVAHTTIWERQLLNMNYFYGSHKQSWFSKLYASSPSGSTPLRTILRDVGKWYANAPSWSQGLANSTNMPDPVLPQGQGGSCQQNFAILTTDGYWNDGITYTNQDNNNSGYSLRSEGIYDGGTSRGSADTLADVAQYYYKTDLRSGLPDLVKKGTKDTQCSAVTSGVTYCHQHMVTHTIGIVPGTMYFRPDYEVATPGSVDPATGVKARADFYHIKQGSTKCAGSSGTTGFPSVNPTTGVETVAGTYECTWPKPSSGGTTALDDLWHAAVNGRGKFYLASDPTTLKNGLTTLLNDISGATQTTGASLSTPTLVPTDSLTFSVVYNPNLWSGEVSALVLDPLTGQPVVPLQTLWTASTLFDQMILNGGTNDGWDVSRKVVTYNPALAYGSRGIPFRYANLSSSQQTYFSRYATTSPASTATDVINFLRGDMSKEGTAFRDRGDVSSGALAILGDIVNSKPQVVDEPDREFADPGYAEYKTAQASRTPVLYVGSNSGMLHAFDASANYTYQMDFPKGCVGAACVLNKQSLPYTYSGTLYTKCTIGTTGCYVQVSTNTNSGKELWAYVPSLLMNTAIASSCTVSSPPAACATTIGALSYGPSNPTPWSHKYYVDGNPVTGDVDFNNTCATPSCTVTSPTAPAGTNWKTILVSGLNKGGKGYFALDVTAGATAGSESTVASKVLWEFTDADMGYTYGDPIIAKTRKYGWVVIVSSGYGNSNGKGYIYVLDAKTGTQLQKLSWSSDPGTTTTPTDLGKITGYTFSTRDLTIEQLYGGDMQGRIWRADLSGTDTTKWTPGILAQLKDGSGNNQPITTTPWIEVSLDTNKRYVMVGTGRWLDSVDMTDNSIQTIYAIVDGDNKSPRCNSGYSTPNCIVPSTALLRGNLTSVSASSTTANAIGSYGWYTDLAAATTTNGSERVTVDPKGALGYGAWAIKVPNLDPCAPSSSGALYLRKLDDASSALTSSGTTIAKSTSASEYVLVGVMKTLATPAGATQATVGFGITNTQGTTTVVKIPLKARSSRFSWREVLN